MQFNAIACNPPPVVDCPEGAAEVDFDCVPITSECPSAAPEAGTRCATEGEMTCWGGDSCFGDEWQATCTNNRWQVDNDIISSCNPPPPVAQDDCPLEQPESDAECWTWDIVTCHYLDGQFTGDGYFHWELPASEDLPVSDATATCDNGSWQVESPPDEPGEA